MADIINFLIRYTVLLYSNSTIIQLVEFINLFSKVAVDDNNSSYSFSIINVGIFSKVYSR